MNEPDYDKAQQILDEAIAQENARLGADVLETKGNLVIQPKPAPQFLTVGSLMQAFSSLPPNLGDTLILCNGKPAYELVLKLGEDGAPNTINIKFFELGLL